MSLRGALRLAVTVALLWAVLAAVGETPLLASLQRSEPRWIVAAGAVLLIQFLVMAWRWQVILVLLSGRKVAISRLALCIGQGMLASQVLPATVGGDAYRMALVSQEVGAAAAVRSVVCDRVLALAILLVLALAVAPLLFARVGAVPEVVGVAAVAAGGLVAFAAMLAFAGHVARLPLAGRALATVAEDARHALLGGRRAWFASALGLATHLLAIAIVYCLWRAVDAGAGLRECLLVVPAVLLVSALPVSIGGWGVREGAFFAGFRLLDADPAAGVTASVLFGASGIVLGIASALVAIAWRDRPASGGDA